jgi:hypothetical protein
MKNQKQFREGIQDKYLNALRDLKMMIETYDGEITLGEWSNTYGLNDAIKCILTKNKIVTNVSDSNKFPIYEWTTINPNIYMVNKILIEMREKSRNYKRNAKNKKRLVVTENTVSTKKDIWNLIENREKSKPKKVKVEKCNYSKKKISIFWGLIKIEK